MERINVIGTSGSGKSTFSRQLADKNCLIKTQCVFESNKAS